MKIPRYESSINNPVANSGRSLTTGTTGSNTLAQIGANAVNAVLDYGAKQNALTAKLRRLEINTNIANGKIAVGNDTQIFLDNMKMDDKFVANPDWAISEFEKMKPKLEKKYKATMDDQTWKEFQPYFWEDLHTKSSKIRQAVNERKINNAVIALETSNQTYLENVNKATSISEIKGLYEMYSKVTLPSFNKFLTNKEGFDKQLTTTKLFTNQKIVFFQASDGVVTENPNGRTVEDWKIIYENLANPNYSIKDINGNEVTVDDDLRKGLITDAKTNYTNQEKIFQAMRNENELKSNVNFTNELMAIASNSVEGINLSKDFIKRLEADTSLEPSTKRTLKTAFTTTINNLAKGTATYESPAGLQTKALLTYLVNGGFIDTKGEYNIINNAMANGYLKPEYATKLIKNAKDNTKERHQWKNGVTKNAISMLTKELNVDENVIMTMISQIGTIQASDPNADPMELLGAFLADNRVPKEAYAAMNQMFAMIAEGESRGISIKEMLMDEKNPNYILNDLITVYKGRIDKAKISEWKSNLSETELASVETLTTGETDYSFNTDKYFDGKKSTAPAISLPVRIEGESVLAYIKRVQKVTKNNKDKYLPEWATGEFNTDSLDMNEFIIMPSEE